MSKKPLWVAEIHLRHLEFLNAMSEGDPIGVGCFRTVVKKAPDDQNLPMGQVTYSTKWEAKMAVQKQMNLLRKVSRWGRTVTNMDTDSI